MTIGKSSGGNYDRDNRLFNEAAGEDLLSTDCEHSLFLKKARFDLECALKPPKFKDVDKRKLRQMAIQAKRGGL